jgi:heme-degrading monooxygenase HmoA
MPTLPWTPAEQPEPGAEAVVLGSQLQLRSYRHIVGFMRAAMQVRKQVHGSPGAYGVSLIAQPMRKTFWTLSAWSDQDALDEFVRTSPHTEVMAKFHDRLTDASFTTWKRDASELPKANSTAMELWQEAKDRLANSNAGGTP